MSTFVSTLAPAPVATLCPQYSFNMLSASEQSAFKKEDFARTLKSKPELEAVDILIESIQLIRQEDSPPQWLQKVYLRAKGEGVNWKTIQQAISSLMGTIYLNKVYYNPPVKKK